MTEAIALSLSRTVGERQMTRGSAVGLGTPTVYAASAPAAFINFSSGMSATANANSLFQFVPRPFFAPVFSGLVERALDCFARKVLRND